MIAAVALSLLIGACGATGEMVVEHRLFSTPTTTTSTTVAPTTTTSTTVAQADCPTWTIEVDGHTQTIAAASAADARAFKECK